MKNILPFLLFLLASTPLFASIHISNKSIIEKTIAEMKSADQADDTSMYVYLLDLYEENAFELIWRGDLLQKGYQYLLRSRIDGLNPSDYHYDELSDRLNKDLSRAKVTAEYKVKTDVLMSHAMLMYGKHMIEGKTDPKTFYENWNYQRRSFNTLVIKDLIDELASGNLDRFIASLAPDTEYYRALTGWMQDYFEGNHHENAKLDFTSLPLKKGQRNPEVIELKYRLSQYGSYDTDDPTDEFDNQLEAALKEFQKTMGLVQDGIVGGETLKALNMTLDQKKDIIRVNLEQARWLLHNLPDEFLLVNIAGYELYIFEKHKITYQTPVIVGKPHHETPVFHADMEYVEVNCTWTVPHSIATKEILPAIQRDPNYLESRHFEVLRRGEAQDPKSIDWERYGENNFPFVLRQQPGPFNSLGTMKFIFPNDYAIYLHDTPARYLFDKEGTRAFSHGCVRVKNPEDLAVKILGDQGMTKSHLDDILESKLTQRVFLEKPMPVFLTYWTAFPDFNDDMKMHWVNDIYERDARILAALDM